jgi:hypothetical protein
MKSTALNLDGIELFIADLNACGIEIVIELSMNL